MKQAPPRPKPVPPASFRRLVATLKTPTPEEQQILESALKDAVDMFEKHGR